MSSDPREDLRPLGETAGDASRVRSDRVIRPTTGGAMLDRRFGLEDIDALTEALVASSRGRIERLKGTAHEVEEQLRRKVEESRTQIRTAIDTAKERIEQQVTETNRRTREALESAHAEGFARGEAEGLEQGTRNGFEKGYSEGLEK